MTADASVHAGWYRDPSGRYQERWWDGAAWTGHVRGQRPDPEVDTIEIPAVRARATPAAVETSTPARLSRWSVASMACVYGGAAVVAIGSFLPWVSVSGDVVDTTTTGIDGDGVVTLTLAVVLAVVFTVLRGPRLAAIVTLAIGAVLAVVAAYELYDVSNATGDLPPRLDASASPGIGLLLTGLAAVAVTVGAALALGDSEERDESRDRHGDESRTADVHARRRRHARHARVLRDTGRPRRHGVESRVSAG